MKSLLSLTGPSFVSVALGIGAMMLVGCEKKSDSSHDGHSHAAGDGHDHDHSADDGHDHGADDGHGHDADTGHGHHSGPVIELGTAHAGSFSCIVTRDGGAITPGGDAAFDATVTSASDTAVAVRFWIGAEDAKGSIKAKADIEDPTGSPFRWHTHAEVPAPLPEGTKLWVEIETESGEKLLVSFDLKA